MKGTGLVLLTLVAVAVPRFASAAVVVAEPTGDADPAFLAELKASLETVTAEVPTELNAELRASVTVKDEGVELVVELVPDDGTATIREIRIASMASAIPQARAMGRGALGSLRVAAPSRSRAALSEATYNDVGPLRIQESSPDKYSRHTALLITVLPTTLLPVTGGLVSLFSSVGAPLLLGPIIGGTGLVFGPATGYFWIGEWKHALIMSGIRLALAGIGTLLLSVYLVASFSSDSNSNWRCEDEEGVSMENCDTEKPNVGLLIGSIISLTALIITSFVDAALVGRAADRANTEWREKNKPTVQVTPVAWTSSNGNTAYGLALQGTF